eukprot:CAMPEP_0201592634 /NCGR_PEP_ID=MMETSP0190_2-20130828/190478_1 /ASSEMBLY_ACC=CAM_ASM_000263 /TAXON_ID=37353 /ORGANISM="Rosalina sp." /LENGTH=802 /DNA_ID=CAMNT_0048051499 /DNA_START=17 /DNA_END=2422 /DNA_ORIENTATION=-
MASVFVILALFVTVSLSQKKAPKIKRCKNYDQCDVINVAGGQVFCNGASSCNYDCTWSWQCDADTSIVSTNANKGNIRCNGASSCSLTDTITAAVDLYCEGSDACWGSTTVTAGVINCDGSDACGDRISDPATFNAATKQNCNGWSSCANSYGSSNPGNAMNCYGAESCYYSKIDAGQQVWCGGSSACYQADITAGKAAKCVGYRSCEQAVIRDVFRIEAYGYESLKDAQIFGGERMDIDGYRVMEGAVVDSDTSTDLEWRFDGPQAGYGSTFICRSGAICRMWCERDTCENMTYQCDTGADCRLTPSQCKSVNPPSDVNGVICPTYVTGTSSPHNHNEKKGEREERRSNRKVDVEEDITLKSMAFCSSSTSCTACERAAECRGQTITESGWASCSGLNSCQNAKITMTGNTHGNDASYLYCSGEAGCKNGRIDSNSRVYCHGKSSCALATILADEWVSCGGSQSCKESVIRLGSGVTAINGGVGVDCRGKESCYGSEIIRRNGDDGTLSCGGIESCAYSDIEYTIDVECGGTQSCDYSNITTTNGDVYCGGAYGCRYSNINVNKAAGNGDGKSVVYMYGDGAGYSATISADRVYGYGETAMMRVTIDSEGRDDIIVEAFGPSSVEVMNLICRDGSECLLRCKENNCYYQVDYYCLDGAVCNIEPAGCLTQCGDETGFDNPWNTCSVTGTDGNSVSCPHIRTNLSISSMQQMIDRKNEKLKTDERIQEFEKRMGLIDYEEYDGQIDGEMDDLYDYEIEHEEMELFGDVQSMNGIDGGETMKILFVTIGTVFIFISIVYLWCR